MNNRHFIFDILFSSQNPAGYMELQAGDIPSDFYDFINNEINQYFDTYIHFSSRFIKSKFHFNIPEIDYVEFDNIFLLAEGNFFVSGSTYVTKKSGAQTFARMDAAFVNFKTPDITCTIMDNDIENLDGEELAVVDRGKRVASIESTDKGYKYTYVV